MGTISDNASETFRDYETEGVPASGAHEPAKAEIRSLFAAIETAMGTLSLGSVDVVKDTRANLNADLAHIADSIGLVYADATDANNDLYIKVGGSGSGSWTLTTILHDVIEGAAASFSSEAEDWADIAAGAAADARASADAAAANNAVILIVYGQSLSVALAPAVTTSPIAGLLMFNGGFAKALFPDYTVTAGALAQNVGNLASLVDFLPSTSVEGSMVGAAVKILQEDGIERVLGFSPGLGGQSITLLQPGTTEFQDLRNAVSQGVELLRAQGFGVEVRFEYDQGQADADLLNDGGGAGSETSTADYKSYLSAMHAGFGRVASAALGRPVTVTTWIVPMLNGGAGSYTKTGIANVIEGQRQAVRDVAGIRYGPAYSQFAASFSTDLTHPLGAAVRYHSEAAGLAMSIPEFAPPQMISFSAIDATHTDVAFSQDIAIDTDLVEATGHTNSKYGFELFIGATQYAVTAVAVTGVRTVRLTHSSCSTSNRIVKNGCQWHATTAAAATHMARTHIRTVDPIGTAEDGTVLKNFSISQVIS